MFRTQAWEEVIDKDKAVVDLKWDMCAGPKEKGGVGVVSSWATGTTYHSGTTTGLEATLLKTCYSSYYALENSKQVTVCAKLADIALDALFRQKPRGGIECIQFNEMLVLMQDVSLTLISDRWIWSSGRFGED
ncbi:hypothetical protein Tco_0865289 [Tanacetum coccineum]